MMSENGGMALGESGEQVKTGKSKLGRKALPSVDLSVFSDVEVELTATLGRGSMTVGGLSALEEGDAIALDTPLNGMVDLSLNSRIVARGEIVAVGDQFGVRITEIIAREE